MMHLDYCTLVPDKFYKFDMAGCCALHDEDYELRVKSRKQADEDFYN